MPKINLLDFQVANLIAAGEVVDRPASVVKELLENAIDAGATEIEAEIRRGGVSYIRVTDNGCGMTKDDAEMCILRHATSKIKEAEDLDSIVTLGFRGEALAAISSVSQMEIFTKTQSDKTGTRIVCDCGRITEVSEAGLKKGTTMLVKELFANVPARRKFLKRDQSEGMAVAAVLEKEALSHPEISFKLISDGSLKLQTAGDKKLYNAIYALLGRDFASGMIAVQSKSEAVEVFGYIGAPENVRANRNYQNFFINGRYIKSRTATAALEQAFSSFLEVEKFPCCVLNIILHPALVDVNVHPTKLEVKFSNEKTVFDAIYLAVRNALLNNTMRPELPLEKKDLDHKLIVERYNRFTPVYDRMDAPKTEQTDVFEGAGKVPSVSVKVASEVPKVPFDDLPFVFEDIAKQEEKKTEELRNEVGKVLQPKEREQETASSIIVPDLPIDLPPISVPRISADILEEGEKTLEAEKIVEDLPAYKLIGIAFDTYILVQIDNKLLMIDKHAAHERLLFEKMKKNMASADERYVQLLLLPEKVHVGTEEKSVLIDYEKEIKDVGFVFESDELSDAAIVTGIPGGLEKEQALDLFAEIVERLAKGEGNGEVSRQIAFEAALYNASCKAAMKGGRNDGEAHLEYVVKELLRLPDILYCPHGRPVAFEIPKGTIEHRFKRS